MHLRSLILASALAASPILTPDSAQTIQSAFAKLAPELRYDSISIDHDHVVAKLCETKSPTCFTVRLAPAAAKCSGQSAGPFCVSYPDSQPSPDDSARIISVLGGSPAAVWSAPPTPAPPRNLLRNSVLLVLVPLLLGGFLALPFRRRRSGWIAFVACFAIPIAVAAAWSASAQVIGLWDAVVEAILFGAGFASVAHMWLRPRAALALAGIVSILGLAAIEFAARRFLPPPGASPFSDPHLLLADARQDPESPMEVACTVAYGDNTAGVFHFGGLGDRELPGRFPLRPDAKPRVLHVGDSMVYGEGVDRSLRFTTLLERLEPGSQHVNAGAPGTGPDAYLIALRKWLDAGRFDTAAIYLFAGNDLADLDRPAPCCADQPLLNYDGTPTLRCPKATAGTSAWSRLRQISPAPYLVKTLSMVSVASAHAASGWFSAPWMEEKIDEPDSVRWAHLESILKAARDEVKSRGTRFIVVVLPLRAGRGSVEAAAAGAEMLRRSRALGIETLDGNEPIAEMLRRSEDPFLPANLHFGIAGHEALAKWLHERLTEAK